MQYIYSIFNTEHSSLLFIMTIFNSQAMLEEVLFQRAKAQAMSFHMKLLQQLLDLFNQLRALGKKFNVEVLAKPENIGTVESGSMEGLQGEEKLVAQYIKDVSSKENDEVMAERDEKMELSDEILLPLINYSWQDKFRPRKPRYYNRVRTGWERNKYNLTHYDHDNPPPKIIQGYKFTIFYPDLIDKTKTPKYFLEKCADSTVNSEGFDDFVIIRFHAGPPYEDVAFKIINREWDIHRRSGLLSVFDRGILLLNFNFKRRFYRR